MHPDQLTNHRGEVGPRHQGRELVQVCVVHDRTQRDGVDRVEPRRLVQQPRVPRLRAGSGAVLLIKATAHPQPQAPDPQKLYLTHGLPPRVRPRLPLLLFRRKREEPRRTESPSFARLSDSLSASSWLEWFIARVGRDVVMLRCLYRCHKLLFNCHPTTHAAPPKTPRSTNVLGSFVKKQVAQLGSCIARAPSAASCGPGGWGGVSGAKVPPENSKAPGVR